MMKRDADGQLVVHLLPKHRWSIVISILGLTIGTWIFFAWNYFFPGSIFPRVTKEELEAPLVLLSVGLGFILAHLVYVGIKEEWFGAVFSFDRSGIRKQFPSGRQQYIPWQHIERASSWTGTIRSVDGQKLYLGFYGNVGFSREVFAAIYEVAGRGSVFARQFSGQPAEK